MAYINRTRILSTSIHIIHSCYDRDQSSSCHQVFTEEKGGCIFNCLNYGGGGDGGVVFSISTSCVCLLPHNVMNTYTTK